MIHDKLQADAFQWAHNTFPQVRGLLFAALNEIKPVKGESKVSHMQRISHAKAIGLQKGILDLLLIMPGATYGFDAKIKPDKFGEKQLVFVEKLRQCGGDGYEFYNLEQFKAIFINIISKHYGPLDRKTGEIL